MALYNNFPYTNFHEMNLDWILQQLKELVDEWEQYGTSVTATAHVSTVPEVIVTGDLKDQMNFDFGLVQGPRGLTGATGAQGPEGPAGSGIEIKDVYATLADLQAAHPTGSAGDAYLVGSDSVFNLYVWSTDQSAWVDGGSLTSPSPYNGTPVMDGVASAGSILAYAKGDHVHPSDTTKMDIASNVQADEIAVFNNSGQVVGSNASVTDFQQIVSNPVVDDIATLDAYGNVQDSNVSISDIALQSDLASYLSISDAEEFKCLKISTSSFSTLPQTVNDADISSDMVVIASVLSNPAAQISQWSVTTTNGSLTIDGSINGTTAAELYLLSERS